jgi:hypothetical protein
MRSSQFTKKLAVQGLLGACLVAATSQVYADAPAAKWYDTIGMSGYLQGSYVGNLNTPHNVGTGIKANNPGRVFDKDSNGFNFNTFLLQIAKPVGDSDHYGFTVRLRTGQDAATIVDGSKSFAVQEAYGTYAIPSLTKLQITGGKFVTPEGFEGVDTVNNPNFSEGLLFGFAEPITHTGLKASYTVNDKVTAMIGVVNGWDTTNPDNNTAKTLIWQLATTPIKMLTWSFQGTYGKELADPTHSQKLSLDTVLGITPIDKLTLNGQLNWGQQSNDPMLNTTDGGAAVGTTHWFGAGLWASYATTSKFTETVRFEILSDENGANVFGSSAFANEPTPSTFTNQTVKEFTLTHKTMLTSNFGNRIEYRHDWSNEPYFLNSATAVKNQNTISTDFFVTF